MIVDIMEPGIKSPRCDSTSKREDSDVEDEDRLSFLPNHVVHHIFSYLNIEEIAILSLASKKCEELCLSIPSLTIDESVISFCGGSDERVQFMDFLVSFMKRRKGVKMTQLIISWYIKDFPHREIFRIMSLINHAIGCSVDTLFLDLNFNSLLFVMPLDVFWSESLTRLSVTLSDCKLEFPSPYGFSHLKHLQLEEAEIVDDSLGEWISSVCKFLEELRLTRICGMKKFKISSQSLLEIHIMSCTLNYLDISTQSLRSIILIDPFDPSNSPSLNIYAPNILILCCSGIHIDEFIVEKTELEYFVHLVLASSIPMKADEFKSLLPSIVQVTELEIDFFSIQKLYQNNCLPFVFSSIQSLVLLHGGLTNITIPAISHFLQGLPHSLKKFRMYHSFDEEDGIPSNEISGYDSKFWESRKLLFVDGLEEVHIDICGGRKNEEVLAGFLLENAKKLKKVTISSGHSMPTKLAHQLVAVVAASTDRAELHSQGNKLVVEFKPQLDTIISSQN